MRWYCRYQLSYCDLEEMMRERGLSVDHVTIFRWVQRYAPEINKRMRPHLKMSGASYRLDETYVKVGTEWKYLPRRRLGRQYHRVYAFRKAGRFRSKAVLYEDDEGRASPPAVHDRHGQARLISGGLRDFSEGENTALGLQITAGEVHQQYNRTRPQSNPHEVASNAMLPLLPYRRASDRRHRDTTHDEEGAGQKVGR
jgi:hypothetical protein